MPRIIHAEYAEKASSPAVVYLAEPGRVSNVKFTCVFNFHSPSRGKKVRCSCFLRDRQIRVGWNLHCISYARQTVGHIPRSKYPFLSIDPEHWLSALQGHACTK